MFAPKFILMPLLGGVIGYITNDIAIKMLFRPRKAVYIGKWKLPFTPGLIPRQKERIARSIGNVVSVQLLNAEALRAAVLSEESTALLRGKITDFLGGFAGSGETVESLAVRYVGRAVFEGTAETVESNLERVIVQKIRESDIGASIVERSMDFLRARLGTGIQAALFNREFMGQIESVMASAINELINRLAPEVIHEEVRKISREIREKRVCDLYEKYQDRIPDLVERMVSLYKKALGDNLERIVQAVDISGIVYKRVSAFDARELEELIFGIMKKELRAIVYLGALLGFLMGFLNILLL